MFWLSPHPFVLLFPCRIGPVLPLLLSPVTHPPRPPRVAQSPPLGPPRRPGAAQSPPCCLLTSLGSSMTQAALATGMKALPDPLPPDTFRVEAVLATGMKALPGPLPLDMFRVWAL